MKTRSIAVEDLHTLACSALTQGGVPATDAADIADVLVGADLFGIHTHGVARIPQYLNRVNLGGVNARPNITVHDPAPSIRMINGDNGIGPLVGRRALHAALEAAATTGVGVAFVKGSNHFGPVMPYLFEAAGRGFASIIASNATTTIAPWGGKATKVGNNPLGWGVPSGDDEPILFDVALSVVARAKIRAAAAAGTKIPTTWATDADGVPTDDPTAALAGFLQPIAGHKGYGLSVMVDLFAGVLSGASYLDRISSWSVHPEVPQDLGHFFLVIDTAPFCSTEELRARTADFRQRLFDTPPTDPASPVRLPGQLELQNWKRQRRDGVEIPASDLDRMHELSAVRSIN